MAPKAKSGMATWSILSRRIGDLEVLGKRSAGRGSRPRPRTRSGATCPATAATRRGTPSTSTGGGQLERTRPRTPPGRSTSPWSRRSGPAGARRRAAPRSRPRPLDRAVRPSSTTRVTAKVALKSGSSQQGKARRASAGSNWVTAMTVLDTVVVGERAAVEAVQLVVEDAGEAQVQPVAGRRAREGRVEADGGSLGRLVELDADRSRVDAGRRLEAGLVDLQLGGVADQRARTGSTDVEGDDLLALEARRRPGQGSVPARSAAAGRCGAAGSPRVGHSCLLRLTVRHPTSTVRRDRRSRDLSGASYRRGMERDSRGGDPGPRHRRRAGPLRRRRWWPASASRRAP